MSELASTRTSRSFTRASLSVVLSLALGACVTSPIESPSMAAVAPTATPTTTPEPTPLVSPRQSPSIPNVLETVDATVHEPPVPPALSSVAFADVATGWAGGDGVILGTKDGGATWLREWSGGRSISSLSAVDRLHVWGLAFDGLNTLGPTADQLIRTSDGGRSWSIIKVSGGFRQIAFSNTVTGWAIVGGISDTTSGPGTLETTTDGGRNWRASTLGKQVDSVCFAGASVGWAATGSGVFRTLDGGHRWLRVTGGPNDASNAGWQALVECRASSAWVFWNGGGGLGSEGYWVTRTLDDGAHWKMVLAQLDDALHLPNIDAYAESFASSGSRSATFLGLCPACGYGTWSVTRSTDGGRTVSHTPLGGLQGAVLDDITFSDVRHGWIAGAAAGGFLLATDDGGKTWRRSYPSNAPRPAVEIAFVSTTIGFGLGVVGDDRAIVRTDDGGGTWRAVGRLPVEPIEPQSDPILSFVDASHGWVAIANGLLTTTDGGQSWHRVSGALPGGVSFADSRHGCAGSYYTQAVATVDGGATWAPVDAGRGLVVCAASLLDPAWVTAAAPFDPGNLLSLGAVLDGNHAWAFGTLAPTQPGGTTEQFGIESTADGGTSWTAYRWPVDPEGTGGLLSIDTLVRLSFVSAATGWALTLFGRLYETKDGGATWTELLTR